VTVWRRVRLPSLIPCLSCQPSAVNSRGVRHGGDRASNTRARGFDSFTPCQKLHSNNNQPGPVVQREDTTFALWRLGFESPPRPPTFRSARSKARLFKGWSSNGKMPRLHRGDWGSIPHRSTDSNYRLRARCESRMQAFQALRCRCKSGCPLQLRRWFNGRIPACQAGDPGSIPGRRSVTCHHRSGRERSFFARAVREPKK
jgi:hypothetical protein